MSNQILVLGYGSVGAATVAALRLRGTPVRVAQRSKPANLPPDVPFTPCDTLDLASLEAAVAGAAQVVVALGFAYDGKFWQDVWPRAMQNLVDVCAKTGARMVFVDNLYMYGPQTEPLHEDVPLSDLPRKPAVRSEVTRIWQAAAGRVRVAALRAPDFYGPGAGPQSQLGDLAFGALAGGKTATLVLPPDIPHEFAYVPDFARGVVSLLDAPDEDFGQAWHLPCAPTLTPRQILEIGAAAIGAKVKISALPPWSLPILGLAMPILRELYEMRFQFNRPYRVDSSKFAKHFWGDATPFEIGAVKTAQWFKDKAKDSA